jgi:phosphatidate cytidylyltransferase
MNAASAAQPSQATMTSLTSTSRTSLVRSRLPRLREIKVHPRFVNLADRTVPAVVLLSVLLAVAHKGGELGLRYLLVLLTPGLYNEAVSVAAAVTTSSSSSMAGRDVSALLIRWGWFVAYSLIVTLPSVAPAAVKGEQLRYAGYATSLVCWMGWILRLNANKEQRQEIQSSDDQGASRFFKSAWNEVASYHVAALVALVPVHSLLAVLKSGRMDWALYASLLVICNDTFAYLVGHFLGKRPLLPVISPKKTLEGWAGGFVLTTLASPLLWRRLFDVRPYTVHSLHIALFGSLVAPFGGYLASTAKRAFGQKDFGSLLGSHGGLMDRLDCQLITAPYLYLFLALIGEL